MPRRTRAKDRLELSHGAVGPSGASGERFRESRPGLEDRVMDPRLDVTGSAVPRPLPAVLVSAVRWCDYWALERRGALPEDMPACPEDVLASGDPPAIPRTGRGDRR